MTNKKSTASKSFMRALLLLFLISISATHVHAQSAVPSIPYRILILHGVWKNDFWEREFDKAFQDALGSEFNGMIHTSSQYLGLNRDLSPQTRQRLQVNLESIIREQDVELVVAVLPAAISFYQEMPISLELPSLLVLPQDSQIPESIPDDLGLVISGSSNAMRGTLEDILATLPDTETIEVHVGNSDSDLIYLERFQAVAAEYADRLQFHYSIGMARDAMLTTASNLPPNSVIIDLPYETFGENKTASNAILGQQLIAGSNAPTFGIYDTQLRQSLVGGHMTTVQGTAAAAVVQTMAIMNGNVPGVTEQVTESIYSWPEAQRWDVNLNRLERDYRVVDRPSTLVEDYPLSSAFIINAIALLTLGLFVQNTMYRRSQAAKARITESEQQARESEEKYRLLAKNVADVIWIYEDGDTHFKYCSPSIRRVSGYTAEEFLRLPIDDFVAADDLEQITKARVSDESGQLTKELQLRKKDGEEIWVEMVVRISRVLSNGKREWVGVTRDITQRKKNELEKHQLEDQVRQSQKFESLGTLAGGIAHDFNNILTVIFGITDMLKLNNPDDQTSQKLLRRLSNASDKARALVQQILTFSRQSKGERRVEDLGELAQDCIQLLQSGKPQNVEFSVNTEGDGLLVLGNSNQLEQTIINLVTNSIEAVSETTGKITVDIFHFSLSRPLTLRHGELDTGKYVCLKVSDNGVGISADALGKMFDPFYTSKELGNGMGLAIVHGIVLDHGGAIDVVSELNLGTTVQVYLPLSDTASLEKHQDEQTVHALSAKQKILLVDDQEELLEIATEMLTTLGHDCVVAPDGESAIKILNDDNQSIDVVITDYSMPGMNGLELMHYCWQNHPSIPIIVSSGYGDQTTGLSGHEGMNFGVLDKPYDLARLSKALNAAIQG